MDYSWILFSLLIIGFFFIVFINPKVKDAVAKTALQEAKKHEGYLVYAIYNGLPDQVKQKVGSENVAKLVEFVVDELLDFVDGMFSKKK